MFAMSLAGFALLGWLATQAWFYTGLGVQPQHERAQRCAGPAAVHAGRAGVHLFISPIVCAAVAQARVRGRRLCRGPNQRPDLASALLKLYEDNASTLTPDPVYVKFYYSHPPASERLARMAP
jgi:STE24 endopeptidase